MALIEHHWLDKYADDVKVANNARLKKLLDTDIIELKAPDGWSARLVWLDDVWKEVPGPTNLSTTVKMKTMKIPVRFEGYRLDLTPVENDDVRNSQHPRCPGWATGVRFSAATWNAHLHPVVQV